MVIHLFLVFVCGIRVTQLIRPLKSSPGAGVGGHRRLKAPPEKNFFACKKIFLRLGA
jgi:hypothetical protein